MAKSKGLNEYVMNDMNEILKEDTYNIDKFAFDSEIKPIK